MFKNCTESEYFELKVRIFVHAKLLSTKILNLSANYLNNSLCVAAPLETPAEQRSMLMYRRMY